MFKFRNTVTVAPPTAASVASDFPSSDAVATIRGLFDRVEGLKKELNTAARALTVAIRNRESIELSGGSPDDAIRTKQSALNVAKRNLANAQNDFRRAFIAEGDRCRKSRAEAWANAYSEIVEPRVGKLTAAQQMAEDAASEIIAALQDGSETMRRLAALDEAANTWDSLCRELNAPGNSELRAVPATKTIFASFLQAIKFREFEVALTALRNVLDPPPGPERMKTEEELAIERERVADRQFLQSSENERRSAAERTELAKTSKL